MTSALFFIEFNSRTVEVRITRAQREHHAERRITFRLRNTSLYLRPGILGFGDSYISGKALIFPQIPFAFARFAAEGNGTGRIGTAGGEVEDRVVFVLIGIRIAGNGYGERFVRGVAVIGGSAFEIREGNVCLAAESVLEELKIKTGKCVRTFESVDHGFAYLGVRGVSAESADGESRGFERSVEGCFGKSEKLVGAFGKGGESERLFFYVLADGFFVLSGFLFDGIEYAHFRVYLSFLCI